MTDNKIPFNEGTKIYQIFMTLSDQEWHCGKCELPGTQPAKAIQIIRQHGYDVEKSTIYCETCEDKTVHRRLKSLEPTQASFVRAGIPSALRKRILKLYDNREAVTLQKLLSRRLEVDHRFPQVRWSKDESLPTILSDSQLRERFQLLTRANNLWKSRYCERCADTGTRGTFIGIDYFYEGGPTWDPSISSDDPRGCVGCFWYDPDAWRASLNALLRDLEGGE